MSDRLKMPPFRDVKFYQRRKHDKWREVQPPTPALEAPVADSHAHVHMLPDSAWELERAAANGVDFVCQIMDPSEDDLDRVALRQEARSGSSDACVIRHAAGVHPHNAKLYTHDIEEELIRFLAGPQVVALGEVGLDYHYDLSPREVQREVFRRQVRLALRLDVPLALHVRNGETGEDADAHAQAFEILREEGALGPRTLLHCCTLPPDELAPWIGSGCYIAYGGAVTFKSADAVREGARLVPDDRLLLETDSPYMTPEPMRGAACTPSHIVFTAALVAQARDCEPGVQRERFLRQVHANTLAFYRLG